MSTISGQSPFQFTYRRDLHNLPTEAIDFEINLHTTFTQDCRDGFGAIYYGMHGYGLIRIESDLQTQSRIDLPEIIQAYNLHSVRFVEIDNVPHLVLTANDAERVFIVTLDGTLTHEFGRPEFAEYASPDTSYKPTDTFLHGDLLYIADGYGANYISVVNIKTQEWVSIFGGHTEDPLEHGKFRCAHGVNITPDGNHLVILDRWHARIEHHNFDGELQNVFQLKDGLWICFVDYIQWKGRWLALITCLYDDPDSGTPAPLLVCDGESYEILSRIEPKADLDIGSSDSQRMHNAMWHVMDDKLYIIGHGWNPGVFFVLENHD